MDILVYINSQTFSCLYIYVVDQLAINVSIYYNDFTIGLYMRSYIIHQFAIKIIGPNNYFHPKILDLFTHILH